MIFRIVVHKPSFHSYLWELQVASPGILDSHTVDTLELLTDEIFTFTFTPDLGSWERLHAASKFLQHPTESQILISRDSRV